MTSGQRAVKEKIAQRSIEGISIAADAGSYSPSPSAVRRPPFTATGTSAGRPPLMQLRWRCRRGMRELDVVLERYLEQRYASAPETEQQAFESLLDLPDPQLFAYLMRRETPVDSGWVDVIAKLAAFEPRCSYPPD